jgi:hypothetical protein
LEFFQSVILLGDLDTSRAILFVEMLREDAAALRTHLVRLKESGSLLSAHEQREVEEWLKELEIIQNQ